MARPPVTDRDEGAPTAASAPAALLPAPLVSPSTALVLASAGLPVTTGDPIPATQTSHPDDGLQPPPSDPVQIPRLLPPAPSPRARVWINGEEVEGSGRFGHLARSYE